MHGYAISEVYISRSVETYALKSKFLILHKTFLQLCKNNLSGRHKSQLNHDTANHILQVYQNIMHVTAG